MEDRGNRRSRKIMNQATLFREDWSWAWFNHRPGVEFIWWHWLKERYCPFNSSVERLWIIYLLHSHHQEYR